MGQIESRVPTPKRLFDLTWLGLRTGHSPTPSSDHLISSGKDRGGHSQAKGRRRPAVCNQLKPRRQLYRQVVRRGALQDAIDIAGRLAELIVLVETIGYQPPGVSEPERIGGGKPVRAANSTSIARCVVVKPSKATMR